MIIYDINTGFIMYDVTYEYGLGYLVWNAITNNKVIYRTNYIQDEYEFYEKMMDLVPKHFWTNTSLLKPFIDKMKLLSLVLGNKLIS